MHLCAEELWISGGGMQLQLIVVEEGRTSCSDG